MPSPRSERITLSLGTKSLTKSHLQEDDAFESIVGKPSILLTLFRRLGDTQRHEKEELRNTCQVLCIGTKHLLRINSEKVSIAHASTSSPIHPRVYLHISQHCSRASGRHARAQQKHIVGRIDAVDDVPR